MVESGKIPGLATEALELVPRNPAITHVSSESSPPLLALPFRSRLAGVDDRRGGRGHPHAPPPHPHLHLLLQGRQGQVLQRRRRQELLRPQVRLQEGVQAHGSGEVR